MSHSTCSLLSWFESHFGTLFRGRSINRLVEGCHCRQKRTPDPSTSSKLSEVVLNNLFCIFLTWTCAQCPDIRIFLYLFSITWWTLSYKYIHDTEIAQSIQGKCKCMLYNYILQCNFFLFNFFLICHLKWFQFLIYLPECNLSEISCLKTSNNFHFPLTIDYICGKFLPCFRLS